MTEITVQELKEKKESDENFLLLDVREDVEYLVSNIGGHHIPMGQLDARLKELEEYKKSEIVVMCRSGNRSSQAGSFLERNGFEEVKNLQGGIKKWADEIDPSIPVM